MSRRDASVATSDDELGSSPLAKDNYDIVKVDLDYGRDYPIYIGTGYSDEECTLTSHLCRTSIACVTARLTRLATLSHTIILFSSYQ